MNRTKGNAVLGVIGRIMAVIGVTLLLLIIFLYSAIAIIVRGPSETAKELFVYSMKETSVGGILVDITMTRGEIEAMMGKKESGMDAEVLGGAVTDPSKIQININRDDNNAGGASSGEDEGDGIEIIPIKTGDFGNF